MIRLNSLKITPDILTRIGKIDEFKGLWNGLDDHTTGLNLIGDVAEHGTKFKKILEPLKNYDLTIAIVKTLHMSISRAEDRGQIKTEANTLPIKNATATIGELETSDPEDTEALLIKLLDWTNKSLNAADHHPLTTIAVFTAIFLQIAPFRIENIKLAKLLVTLLLLKSDYRYAPFASLDDAANSNAENLLKSLGENQASLEAGQPDWHSWLICFFDILIDHKTILYNNIYGDEKADTLANMPSLSIAIIECVRANKRTTMKQIMQETRGKRATIKLRLKELTDTNRLKRHGAGRGVWYSLI